MTKSPVEVRGGNSRADYTTRSLSDYLSPQEIAALRDEAEEEGDA